MHWCLSPWNQQKPFGMLDLSQVQDRQVISIEEIELPNCDIFSFQFLAWPMESKNKASWERLIMYFPDKA